MRRIAAITLALCATLGCNWFEAPPDSDEPDPPAPVAPTVETLYAEIRAGFDPLYQVLPMITQHSLIPDAFRESMLTHARDVQSRHGDTELGKQAIARLVTDLERQLPGLRSDQNFPATLLLCELITVFDPENPRARRFEAWARELRNRPVVVIQGWYQPIYEDIEVIYAFLEVYLPETGEVHNIRVRRGDEFDGLRFVKILGKNRGIEFEHLETGDRFEVYVPRWRN